MEAKKKWYKWTYLQNRKRFRLRDCTYDCRQVEVWREGTVKEFRMDMYTLLYFKWITNKDLLSGTWNSAQCYVAVWTGGKFEGEWIHVYVWLSSFTVHLRLSQHCLSIGYTPMQNKKLKIKNEKASFPKWKEPQSAESCYLLCETTRKCKIHTLVLLPERITEIN